MKYPKLFIDGTPIPFKKGTLFYTIGPRTSERWFEGSNSMVEFKVHNLVSFLFYLKKYHEQGPYLLEIRKDHMIYTCTDFIYSGPIEITLPPTSEYVKFEGKSIVEMIDEIS